MTTSPTALLVAVDGNLDQRPLDAELPENVKRLGTIDSNGDFTKDEDDEITPQQRRSSGIVSTLGYGCHAYYLNGYLGKRHSEWFPIALDRAARKASDDEITALFENAAARSRGARRRSSRTSTGTPSGGSSPGPSPTTPSSTQQSSTRSSGPRPGGADHLAAHPLGAPPPVNTDGPRQQLGPVVVPRVDSRTNGQAEQMTETRQHAEEPAEGSAPGDEQDGRTPHPEEPAEGSVENAEDGLGPENRITGV